MFPLEEHYHFYIDRVGARFYWGRLSLFGGTIISNIFITCAFKKGLRFHKGLKLILSRKPFVLVQKGSAFNFALLNVRAEL